MSSMIVDIYILRYVIELCFFFFWVVVDISTILNDFCLLSFFDIVFILDIMGRILRICF